MIFCTVGFCSRKMNDETNATVGVVGDASVLHLDGPSFRYAVTRKK